MEQSSASAGASTDGGRNGHFADAATPMHVDVNDPIYKVSRPCRPCHFPGLRHSCCHDQTHPSSCTYFFMQAMIAAAKEQPKRMAAELPPPPALPSGQRGAEQQQHVDQRRLSSPFTRPSPARESSMDTSQQRSAPARSK